MIHTMAASATLPPSSPSWPSRPLETSPPLQPSAQVHRAPAVLRSADLLGTQQAIEIDHNGQRYRLQTTRAGKLILTK